MLEITYNRGNLIVGDGPEYVGLDEIIFYIPKQFYEYLVVCSAKAEQTTRYFGVKTVQFDKEIIL